MTQVFTKDPATIADYAIDWTAWLAGDTIDESEWTVPDDLTVDSDAQTTTQTSVWLSAGTAAIDYRKTHTLTNHIITVAGREEDKTIYIQMREK